MRYRQRHSIAPGAFPPVLEPLERRLLLDGTPLITEFMANNTQTCYDQNGRASDWIEIYNPTAAPINLAGWHLTDDPGDLSQWTFPDVTLDRGAYLIVFASDTEDPPVAGQELHANFALNADGDYLALVGPGGRRQDIVSEFTFPAQRKDISYGVKQEGGTLTLVDAGAHATALIPTVNDSHLNWIWPDYDDQGWLTGRTGVGYENDNGYQALIGLDVRAMYGVTGSVYIRIEFDVASPADLTSLMLQMQYDDGFVAFLNGELVASANGRAVASLAWNSTASASHADNQAVEYEGFDLSGELGHLQVGLNVLAIQGLNFGASSTDLLLLPRLVATTALTGPPDYGYLLSPTPRLPNTGDTVDGFVGDTAFSRDRGFYSEPFDVWITTDTAGAAIYYTTDGSAPSEANGARFDPAQPIRIGTTTTLRAVAVCDGWLPSNIDTHTYVFLGDVLAQPAGPEGFPSVWGSTTADYEMDPDIVNNPQYHDLLLEGLAALPTMSLVMDVDDLFGASGIYTNPWGEGITWERPASVELFYPEGYQAPDDGFQVDCGVRMYGGVGRDPPYRKHAFRLLFKGDYGPTKLKYSLFGEDAADAFDTIILRHNFNDGYTWGGDRSQYIRDEYVRQLQLALGDPSPHGTFVHLYVNGLYWGLYNPVERPDQAFASTYLGGEKEDWDAINAGETTGDSDMADWNAMVTFCRQGLTTSAAYQRLQGNNPDGTDNPAYPCYLDVDNYINYLLVNFFTGNSDWPGHNWYAARQEDPGSGGFASFAWDSEWVVGMNSGLTQNMTGASSSIAEPYSYLRQNEEFRLRFADLAHQAFFNGGPFYVDPAHAQWDPAHPEWNRPAALYASLADGVESAMVAESARWGDVVSGAPYTLAQWQSQRDWILGTYMPQRAAIVLDQLRSAGLYPSVAAPSFNINGVYQHGGTIARGAALTMSPPGGTVYYTLDGTDPRLLGGSLSPTARVYTGSIALNASTQVRARARVGGTWSALNEAVFLLGTAHDLRVTEIMYNPAPPTQAEQDQGFTRAEDFEYLELQNISGGVLNLQWMALTQGVQFHFPNLDVPRDGYVLVVRNEAAFRARYGAGCLIAGTFEAGTGLSAGGEDLRLELTVGQVIHDFHFADQWYDQTDGEGFSLVIRDPLGDLALWDVKEGWRPSGARGGSPGTQDVGYTPGIVVISEVLAHTDNPATGDWIELRNTTGAPVNVGGWFLSDDPAQLDLWEIPANTWIPTGGYRVFTQNGDFGGAFALSELGEGAYLSSQAPDGSPGGYREQRTFGASDREVTFGVYTKSTGGTDFVPMAWATPGEANGLPLVGPVVINEVMYNPRTGHEFIELYNRTGAAIPLHDAEKTPNPWKFTEGIDYTFPVNASIPAHGYALVVAMDPAVFRSLYAVPAAVPIYGPYVGVLADGGESLELQRPGTPEPPTPEFPQGFVPYLRADRLTYDDEAPWPTRPDGSGAALIRLDPDAYGNDVANWGVSTYGGTPGALNEGIDNSPPSVPGITSAAALSPSEIRLAWTPCDDPDTGVAYYRVYRNGRPYSITTATTFVDDTVTPSTTYAYQVSAVNRDDVESALSGPANARVVTVASVSTPNALKVLVKFTEVVTATAQAAACYKVTYSGGTKSVAVSAAAIQAGGDSVLLTLGAALADGVQYALTVTNVVGQSGTPVCPGSQVTFGYYVAGSGTILWEYWWDIDGTAVADLTSDPDFPDNPTGTGERTSFEIPVNQWDRYGVRMRGYVHPPVTGLYVFWISGDDNCELWLSTDDSPANRRQIASVPGWTNTREWTRYAQQQSVAITLQAGQRYYIEALMKEGGGGDNLAVAWQPPGAPFDGLPIPGTYLSPYVAPPDVTVSLVPTDLQAAEAGADRGVVTVRRQGNLVGDLTVYYAVGGTASPADYREVLTGAVTLPSGVASLALRITPVDDTEVEPAETVIFTLIGDRSYLIGSGIVTVTIADDDFRPDVAVSIQATVPDASEQGPQAATFTVSRDGNTAQALTVYYSVGGTAAAADLQEVLPGWVEIPAGLASATITVTPVDDGPGEANETVVLTLSPSSIYEIAVASATVTIQDPNDPPVHTVPGPQNAREDLDLVFSPAGGNAIAVSDVDAAGEAVAVTLTAAHGLLTLSGIAGLGFTVGDGVADATMTFTGSIAAVNAALNGLVFRAAPGNGGAASLSITTDDLGHCGLGAPAADTDTVSILVAPAPDALEGRRGNGRASAAGLVVLDEDGRAHVPALTVHEAEDVDWYKFTVPYGATGDAALAVQSVANGLQGRLALYDSARAKQPMQQAQASAPDQPVTLNSSGLVAGKTYYLEVRGLADTVGLYALDLDLAMMDPDAREPNNDVPTATDITAGLVGGVPGDWYDTALSIHRSTDVDWFRFDAPANTDGSLLVSVSGLTDGLAGSVSVYQDVGGKMKSVGRGTFNSRTPAGQARVAAAQPGARYYLKIDNTRYETGGYILEVGLDLAQEPHDALEGGRRGNGQASGAVPVDPDGLQGPLGALTIHKASDVDWYKFAVPYGATGAAAIRMINVGNGLQGRLALYDSARAKQPMQEAQASAPDQTVTLNSSGLVAGRTYYVEVRGVNQTAGVYDLDFDVAMLDPDAREPNNDAAAATDITAGLVGGVPGDFYDSALSIHRSDDVDWFRFDAPADTAGDLLVSVSGLTGGLAGSVTVYQEAGGRMRTVGRGRFGRNGLGVQVRVRDAQPGARYYLKIDNARYEAGQYILEMGLGLAPPGP